MLDAETWCAVFSAGPEGLHILKLSFENEAVARRMVQDLQNLK